MAEYIERDKIYEVLNSLLNDIADSTDTSTEFDNGWEVALECANDKINDIPDADVRPERHGEWKGYTTSAFHGVDEFGDPIYRDVNVWKCSECNRKSVVKENYCPNCGAMMDGKDGESD